MKFYEDFAPQYDKLVSYTARKRRELPFWKKIFGENNVHTVLDCACGTGHHVRIFDQMGLQVTGSDLSEAMLKVARNRLGKKSANIPLVQCDFRELSKHVSGSFDAIVNLGNSLPHLPSGLEVQQTLGETYKLLKDPGIFILSLRNYDKLRQNQPRFFPVSIRFNHAFIYALDYFPGRIVFNIMHLQCIPRRFTVNSTEYYDLGYEKLLALLNDAGFHDITSYGDFNEKSFDRKISDNLLLIGRK